MNLYQHLGYLVLGSRLRRISESFLAEITRAYQQAGIEFDASWFPVFYLLSQNKSLSIKELSEQTEVSHPAASQLITNLKQRGLVKSTTSKTDARKQQIAFTDKGRALLEQVLPVWDAILLSMTEISESQPGCDALLPAVTAFEQALQSHNLSDHISQNLQKQLNPADHD
jgi:DNA-binding MarR family transcriptional regulator